MEQDNKTNVHKEPVFSIKLQAGRKRRYFFDVRTTKANDYYLTITESKRRFNGDGFERHKIFLYKEDFNNFLDLLGKTIGHVKTELLPDYNFDEFNRKDEGMPDTSTQEQKKEDTPVSNKKDNEDVGKEEKKDEKDEKEDKKDEEDVMDW